MLSGRPTHGVLLRKMDLIPGSASGVGALGGNVFQAATPHGVRLRRMDLIGGSGLGGATSLL